MSEIFVETAIFLQHKNDVIDAAQVGRPECRHDRRVVTCRDRAGALCSTASATPIVEGRASAGAGRQRYRCALRKAERACGWAVNALRIAGNSSCSGKLYGYLNGLRAAASTTTTSGRSSARTGCRTAAHGA